LKSTAISNGDITFAAEKTLVDFGSGTRFYLGNTHDDGTYIHLIATRSDGGDTFRQDIYHFRYKKSDGSVSNADGTHSTVSGSLPINLSDSNTYYRIVDQSTASHYAGSAPTFCADTSGNLHLVYMDGTVAEGTSWDMKHMIFSSGAWGSPSTVVSVTNFNHVNMISIGPLSAGGVELLYPDNDGTYTIGGTTMKRAVYNGSWGSPITLAIDVNGESLNVPSRVLNANDDIRHHFYEGHQASTDSGAGGLVGYAFGAGGVGARSIPANPDGFTWLQLDFTNKSNGATTVDSDGMFYKTITAGGNAQVSSGKAVFDGSGDYFTTPDDDLWSLLNYDFTIDFLGVVFNSTAAQTLLSHRSSGQSIGWFIDYVNTNALRFIGYPGGITASASFTATVGTRYDLAVVRSGNTIYFYNGTNLLGSSAFSITISNSTAPLIIGAINGGVEYFNGSIEKIRMRVGAADYTGSTRTIPSW
jgi:hypothetical protein